jgi:hypothetical protein
MSLVSMNVATVNGDSTVLVAYHQLQWPHRQVTGNLVHVYDACLCGRGSSM